eukprot:363579-Chlamydomonas_euryale.AAC.7
MEVGSGEGRRGGSNTTPHIHMVAHVRLWSAAWRMCGCVDGWASRWMNWMGGWMGGWARSPSPFQAAMH